MWALHKEAGKAFFASMLSNQFGIQQCNHRQRRQEQQFALRNIIGAVVAFVIAMTQKLMYSWVHFP
jgi:hypothetical protein